MPTLLNYLTLLNPTLDCTNSSVGPNTTNAEWEIATGPREWNEFSLETIMAMYGPILQHQVASIPASAPQLSTLDLQVFTERTFEAILIRTVMPEVSMALRIAWPLCYPNDGPADIAEIAIGDKAKRIAIQEDARFYPDWAGVRKGERTEHGYKNLCPGETKLASKWNSSVRNEKRPDYLFPFNQLLTYCGRQWGCRYGYIITPEELVVVLIFGAGAIGAFYGSRLATLGPRVLVSVVCRSNYSAVKQHGFTIESPSYGTYTWVPHQTFSQAEEARGQKWNYIVVSTKALPDVADDSALLEGLDAQAVVLIQNGLGVEEPYARRFPAAKILSAVTIASAAQPQHGRIKHNRWTRINVAPYHHRNGSGSSDQREGPGGAAQEFVNLLVEGGIKDASAYSEDKMQLLRWHKVAINAAMNPSSVLVDGADNASMARDADLGEHLEGVINEVLSVGQKVVGRPFPADFATAHKILQSTQRNTSGSVPSMQLDWASGKKMELEVILGNPIRLAKAKGFDMPRLQSLYALTKFKQKKRDTKL
ncbi:hypothetical protein DV735_g3186, partial [Chaetothyriales sp. CBS 134920]